MVTQYIGTGWNSPVRVDPDGGFTMTGGAVKLEQSMRLILSTYPGERPMRPRFGSRLRDYVYRPAGLDTAAELAEEVRRALDLWEPRVTIDDVAVTPAPDRPYLLDVDIHYTVKATNDRRNLVFPFYTVPDSEQE